MYMPVGSMARLMPLHEASMLYFCLAVNGNRGSVGAGGGGSSCLLELFPSPRCTIASFPSSQPIISPVIQSHI